MNNIVYLRIYQTPEDHEFTHHDLFKTGQLSSMIGHGTNNHTLKSGATVVVVSKSSKLDDFDSINLALVKVKNEVPYNPWKSYGDFQCFDVEFLHSKTILTFSLEVGDLVQHHQQPINSSLSQLSQECRD